MTKRIFKFLTLIFLFVCVFDLFSCGSNENKSIVKDEDDIDEKAEEKQKYVVELNMDNYEKYIDIRYEPDGSNSRICFYGSLPYAFYDDAVITSRVSRSGYEDVMKDIELSSGGYAYWHNTGGYWSYKITGVSGKVIYWI